MSQTTKAAIAATAVVLVAATVLVGLFGAEQGSDSRTPLVATSPTPSPAPAGLDRFYHQRLHWQRCDGGQCTWITVPVDYAQPQGATLRLRAILVPASGGHAARTLFVDPGGPGASAMDFARQFAELTGTKVRAMYDIVGVDPRGVGRSTPLRCLSDAAFDRFIDFDLTPDTDAEVRAYERHVAALGSACRRNSGALADHVSTAEAARDLDVARALLGRPAFDWFGASYGTQLGATYATLFPKRVGRMVLDGAVDPALSAFGSSMAQDVGFTRALDDFIAACNRQKDCPLGRDHATAVRRLRTFFARLDAHPMRVGSRRVTESRALYGVALPLYNKDAWAVLRTALRDALHGDMSQVLEISDSYFDRDRSGHFATNGGQVIYAVNCLDATDRPTEAQVRAHLASFAKASPVFGAFFGWSPLGCTPWPVRSKTPQPAIDATGAPPILVIGTTRDPATPYEEAVALAKELRVGVLITRHGEGHTAYITRSPCITDTVEGFLVAGIVPTSDPDC